MSTQYILLMNILPIFSLLFAVLSVFLAGQTGNPSYSQNVTNDTGPLPIPELKPKAPTSEEPQIPPNRFSAQIEFEPDDQFEDRYDVSNSAMVMEDSKLCPTGNCEFELEGMLTERSNAPEEKRLSGELTIITGDSTRLLNVFATFETVEERNGEGGEQIQVIEGRFELGKGYVTGSERFYRINGTLTPDGSNYIMALNGEW